MPVVVGDAAEETELLTWMLYQMKEDTIENINRDLLTNMIDHTEFLAVFFCKFSRVKTETETETDDIIKSETAKASIKGDTK